MCIAYSMAYKLADVLVGQVHKYKKKLINKINGPDGTHVSAARFT